MCTFDAPQISGIYFMKRNYKFRFKTENYSYFLQVNIDTNWWCTFMRPNLYTIIHWGRDILLSAFSHDKRCCWESRVCIFPFMHFLYEYLLIQWWDHFQNERHLHACIPPRALEQTIITHFSETIYRLLASDGLDAFNWQRSRLRIVDFSRKTFWSSMNRHGQLVKEWNV